MVLSPCSSGTRWLGGNVLDCAAGVRGFESALGLSIALFFLGFFSQIFFKVFMPDL